MCTSNCVYSPSIAWSHLFKHRGSNLRISTTNIFVFVRSHETERAFLWKIEYADSRISALKFSIFAGKLLLLLYLLLTFRKIAKYSQIIFLMKYKKLYSKEIFISFTWTGWPFYYLFRRTFSPFIICFRSSPSSVVFYHPFQLLLISYMLYQRFSTCVSRYISVLKKLLRCAVKLIIKDL